MDLERAKAIAERLKDLLESACERIEIGGSIRRRKPEVGDIELVAIPKYVAGVDQLDRQIRALLVRGVFDFRRNKLGSAVYGPKNKLLQHCDSGIGVDIFSTDKECWPVTLFVRTGGEKTNKEIASLALARSMRFHAYGRGFTQPDGSELICRSEADVFRAVGLAYKEPWERR